MQWSGVSVQRDERADNPDSGAVSDGIGKRGVVARRGHGDVAVRCGVSGVSEAGQALGLCAVRGAYVAVRGVRGCGEQCVCRRCCY